MNSKKLGQEQEPSCDGNDSVNNRVSRRRFLQITGGATAVAAGGGALYVLSKDTAVEQSVQAIPSSRPKAAGRRPERTEVALAPGEAARLRHLRHRRQLVDGVIDSPFDSHEDCERNCTGALFAHEYERSN